MLQRISSPQLLIRGEPGWLTSNLWLGLRNGIVLIVDEDLHIQAFDQQIQYGLECRILDSLNLTRASIDRDARFLIRHFDDFDLSAWADSMDGHLDLLDSLVNRHNFSRIMGLYRERSIVQIHQR